MIQKQNLSKPWNELNAAGSLQRAIFTKQHAGNGPGQCAHCLGVTTVQVLPQKRNKMERQSRETPLQSLYRPFTEINIKRESRSQLNTHFEGYEKIQQIFLNDRTCHLLFMQLSILFSFYFLVTFFIQWGEGTCATEHLRPTTCWSGSSLPPCWSEAGSSDSAANVLTCRAIPSAPIALFMKFYISVCVPWCERGGLRTASGTVLSFHHVSPRDQAQITRLGSKHHLPAEPSCWPSKKKGKDRKYFFLSL